MFEMLVSPYDAFSVQRECYVSLDINISHVVSVFSHAGDSSFILTGSSSSRFNFTFFLANSSLSVRKKRIYIASSSTERHSSIETDLIELHDIKSCTTTARTPLTARQEEG